eukprot:scaffold14295_cov193-Alexandrium_tamarense.AAC.6
MEVEEIVHGATEVMDAIPATTTGKHKRDDDGDDDDVHATAAADANLFALLSDENWKKIASYA